MLRRPRRSFLDRLGRRPLGGPFTNGALCNRFTLVAVVRRRCARLDAAVFSARLRRGRGDLQGRFVGGNRLRVHRNRNSDRTFPRPPRSADQAGLRATAELAYWHLGSQPEAQIAVLHRDFDAIGKRLHPKVPIDWLIHRTPRLLRRRRHCRRRAGSARIGPRRWPRVETRALHFLQRPHFLPTGLPACSYGSALSEPAAT